MKQALLILSALVISSVATIQLIVFPNFQDMVLFPARQLELEVLASGAIDLLSEELQELPKEQRGAYLDQVRTEFGFILSIQPFDRRSFSYDDQVELEKGETLGDPLTDSVYKIIDTEELLVFVNTDTRPSHLVSKAQRYTMGTFFVLQNRFKQSPESDWPAIVQSLSTAFKYPVSLAEINELEYGEQHITALKEGELMSVSTEYSEFIGYPADIIMQRIGNSDKAIILGPVTDSLKTPMNFVFSMYYLIFGLFLLIPIVIWLLPAWCSMRALKDATSLFGQGRFETRAKFYRFSQLNHLSQTYNTMAEKIQRLISSHKNLTNAVSHELRTPIARIEFNVELLRNSSSNAYQLKQLDHIESSLNELNSLVSEMLTYARFNRETPKLEFETAELNHWLEQELKPWRTNNPEKDIVLLENEACTATFERFYMSRAFSNLVRNAIAYGRSSIRISHHETPSDWQLWVEDDGDGIELDHRKKVFAPFYRQDESRNRQTGGTGLGLSIVQQIMDWHEGSASVSSSSLGGACFILSWPKQSPQWVKGLEKK